jgi:hypothetical protein
MASWLGFGKQRSQFLPLGIGQVAWIWFPFHASNLTDSELQTQGRVSQVYPGDSFAARSPEDSAGELGQSRRHGKPGRWRPCEAPTGMVEGTVGEAEASDHPAAAFPTG